MARNWKPILSSLWVRNIPSKGLAQVIELMLDMVLQVKLNLQSLKHTLIVMRKNLRTVSMKSPKLLNSVKEFYKLCYLTHLFNRISL